jgi:hypothetical protein
MEASHEPENAGLITNDLQIRGSWPLSSSKRNWWLSMNRNDAFIDFQSLTRVRFMVPIHAVLCALGNIV